MTNLKLTLIALALCLCIAVPASAMWNNGNWIPDNSNDGYNVHFDPETGVTSKYRDNTPVNEIKASENGNGGVAVGSIRAGFSTLSNTIYVRNVLQGANVSPMVIPVNADATFRIPEPGKGVLAPGNYSATLDNFNLPDETVYFTIAANQQGPTLIGDFIGQAASAPSVCMPFYTIIDAKYGIAASQEWTVHNGDYDKVCHQEVPSTPDVYTIVSGNVAHTGHAVTTSSDYYGFKIGNQKYQFSNHSDDPKYLKVDGTHGREAYCDYVYVVMGTGDYIKEHGHNCNHYKYVAPTQKTVTDGTVIDVTQNVQSAVSQGAITFMLFNNAQNPGGVFGLDNQLLSQIQDPAYGIVKTVSIKYNNGCGLDREIEAMEYDYIDLATGSVTQPAK